MSITSRPARPARKRPRGTPLQRTVSTNVRILMAIHQLQQKDVGEIIGKGDGAIGHKLNGRAEWTIDELGLLADYADWPIARFLDDPSGAPGGIRTPKPSDPKIIPLFATAA